MINKETLAGITLQICLAMIGIEQETLIHKSGISQLRYKSICMKHCIHQMNSMLFLAFFWVTYVKRQLDQYIFL